MNDTVLNRIDLNKAGLHIVARTNEFHLDHEHPTLETLIGWILSERVPLICMPGFDGTSDQLRLEYENTGCSNEHVFLDRIVLDGDISDLEDRVGSEPEDVRVILVGAIQYMNQNLRYKHQRVKASIRFLKKLADSGTCVIAISMTDIGTNEAVVSGEPVDATVVRGLNNDDKEMDLIDTVSLLYWGFGLHSALLKK